MDMDDSEVMHLARINPIIGFLFYLTGTYMDMIPYLKGLILTLDSWITYIDEKG